MIVYEYSNPHPKKLKTNDCVVRAFSLAFNKDYLEVRRNLNKAKREIKAKSYKSSKFLYKYLKDYKRIVIKVDAGNRRPRAKDFINKYGPGTYILSMRGHLVCLKDTKLLDTWDSSDKAIYTAWKVS